MRNKKPEIKFSASAVLELPLGTRRFVLIEETARHKKGLFNLPGGTRDPEDINLLDTATRETKEETGGIGSTDPSQGLDIQIDGLIGVYPHNTKPNHRMVVFSGLVIGGFMRATSEHPTVDAYTEEEFNEFHRMGKLRDNRVIHAMQTYIGGLAIPIDTLSYAQQIRDSHVVTL